jgi:hypothetical protein
MAQSIYMKNQFKLGIWKESLKKNVEELFSKFQNGELNQDDVSNHYFFLLALTQSFSTDFIR